MAGPRYKHVSDCALLVEFGTVVDDEINRQVIALDRAICGAGKDEIPGLVEVVPAMVNLLLVFGPVVTNHNQVQAMVERILPVENGTAENGQHHRINVCYEDELGPDLDAVAKACDLSREAVINAHCGATYRVSMYGFAPGFAYLSGVAEAIQVPRKVAPLRDIPSGSVLIAGPQCLTTTMVMPTGWSIIGRSDVQVMTDDPQRPFLFDVGDSVGFQRVRRDQLEERTG